MEMIKDIEGLIEKDSNEVVDKSEDINQEEDELIQ
jgi:hypothetical protein